MTIHGDADSIVDSLDDIDTLLGSPAVAHPVSFVTGAAGTGKTYSVRARMEKNPGLVLSASTGVAAVNLGPGITTVHTLLRFANLDSLREQYVTGRLARRFRDLAVDEGMTELAIDEVSMLDGDSLDLIQQAAIEGGHRSESHPIKLTLLGDFCQLPPVGVDKLEYDPAWRRWAFEAQCWPEFAKHSTKLTKYWRQANSKFLDALNAARRGHGAACADLLAGLGVQFHKMTDEHFEGTTLRGTNEEVDRFNTIASQQLRGKQWRVRSRRWGMPSVYQILPDGTVRQPADWRLVPEQMGLREGALVMILSNDVPAFRWANGDLGRIEGIAQHEDLPTRFVIRLLRTGETVEIGKVIRDVRSRQPPEDWGREEIAKRRRQIPMWGQPWWEEKSGKWVIGELEYFPLRYAWATSVHKSQSLSLDRVQIDLRGRFVGQPAMVYVALSRCRTPEGLRLVGSKEDLVRKCNVHGKVERWL